MDSLNQSHQNPASIAEKPAEISADLHNRLQRLAGNRLGLQKLGKEWEAKQRKLDKSLSKLPKTAGDTDPLLAQLQVKLAVLKAERTAIAQAYQMAVNADQLHIQSLAQKAVETHDVFSAIEAWALECEMFADETNTTWMPTHTEVRDKIFDFANKLGTVYYAQQVRHNHFEIFEVHNGAITPSKIVAKVCERCYSKSLQTVAHRELLFCMVNRLKELQTEDDIRVIQNPGDLEANQSCLTRNGFVIHYEEEHLDEQMHVARRLAVRTVDDWRARGGKPFLAPLKFDFDYDAWQKFLTAKKEQHLTSAGLWDYAWAQMPAKVQAYLLSHLDEKNVRTVLEASGNFICPVNQNVDGLRGMWFFYGEKSTGKTTWLLMLQDLCPEWVSPIPPCTGRFGDPALTRGVRRIACEEAKMETLNASAAKELASGSRPNVETKGVDTVRGKKRYSIASIACANAPQSLGFESGDEALTDRIHCCYWFNSFKDNSISFFLTPEERNQVYMVCLMGLQIALWDGEFTHPLGKDYMLSATQSDPVMQFTRLFEQGGETSKADIKRHFIDYLNKKKENLKEYADWQVYETEWRLKRGVTTRLWNQLVKSFGKPTYNKNTRNYDTLRITYTYED